MSIEAPVVQVITVSDALYATVVAANALDFTGIDAIGAYLAQVVDNKYIHLEPINIVPKGTPFVVKATAAADYTIPAAVEWGDAIVNNDLQVSDTDIAAAGQYILAKPAGESVGFYSTTTGTIAAGKGYIVLPSAVKALYFEEDDATGINEVNGQWSMANGQSIYNLAGQRMNKMQKGINIVNGKKLMK